MSSNTLGGGAGYEEIDHDEYSTAEEGGELREILLSPLVPVALQKKKAPCCSWKKVGIVSVTLAALYLVLLPAAVSIMVAVAPLTIVDFEMLGLPTSAMYKDTSVPTIRVMSTMSMSKRLPVNTKVNSRDFTILYKNKDLGAMVPDLPLDTTETGKVTFNSSLRVQSTEGFHALGQDLVRKDKVTLHLQSWSSISVPIFGSAAEFSIPFVYISKDITMKACSGLNTMHLEVFDLADMPGPKKDVRLHMRVKLFNPSAVSVLDLGHAKFDVFFRNSFVTSLASEGDMKLLAGSNTLIANGLFRPADVTKTEVLISDFIEGHEVIIDAIAPVKDASDVPLFSAFLAGMNLKAKLRGIPSGVIVAGLMDFAPLKTIADLLLYGKLEIDSQIRLYNPFKALVTVTAVKFLIYYKGVELGSADSKALHVPVYGNSSAYTEKLTMVVDTKGNKSNEEAIIHAIEDTFKYGYCKISLKGVFTITIGQYTFSPPYEQPANILGCSFLDREPCDNAKPPNCPTC